MENTTLVSSSASQKKEDTYSYKGWLNSDSFFKRVFAVLGYNMLGSLIIMIPFYILMFIVIFVVAMIAGATGVGGR